MARGMATMAVVGTTAEDAAAGPATPASGTPTVAVPPAAAGADVAVPESRGRADDAGVPTTPLVAPVAGPAPADAGGIAAPRRCATPAERPRPRPQPDHHRAGGARGPGRRTPGRRAGRPGRGRGVPAPVPRRGRGARGHGGQGRRRARGLARGAPGRGPRGDRAHRHLRPHLRGARPSAPAWRGGTRRAASGACTGAACTCATAATSPRPTRSPPSASATSTRPRAAAGSARRSPSSRPTRPPRPARGCGTSSSSATPATAPAAGCSATRATSGSPTTPAPSAGCRRRRWAASTCCPSWSPGAAPTPPGPADLRGPARRRSSRSTCTHPDHRVVRRPRAALARPAGHQQHAPRHRRGLLPGRAVQRLVHGHRDRGPQPRRRRALRHARRGRRGRWASTPRNDRSMWRDRAAVELTLAVQHSFDVAGVTDGRPPRRVGALPAPPRARGAAGRASARWTGAGSSRRSRAASRRCSTATTTSPPTRARCSGWTRSRSPDVAPPVSTAGGLAARSGVTRRSDEPAPVVVVDAERRAGAARRARRGRRR